MPGGAGNPGRVASPDDELVGVARDATTILEVLDVLHEHDAALCLADRRGPVGPLRATARWAFVRLHAGGARPEPCYGRRALTTWVERIVDLFGASADGYLYCNNDTHACAVRNAAELARIATRAGLDVAAPVGGDPA